MKFRQVLAGFWLVLLCSTALAQGRELPDFTRLVEEQGGAVVNISTTQAVRRAAVPQVPGSLEAVLSALETDNEFLYKGGVFTPDVIETWCDYKRIN